MEEQPVVARCILEILGAPKEFIKKKLEEHIAKLKEDGLDVQLETYEEPKQQNELFSQFVEVQIKFKDAMQLLDFCFDSMPSSVEIISPEKIEVDMANFEKLLNDFQAKLHHTDMMLKNMQAQKMVLDKNALNVLQNFIKFVCRTPHTLDELSSILGLGQKELTAFLSGLIDKGALRKEKEAYVTNV